MSVTSLRVDASRRPARVAGLSIAHYQLLYACGVVLFLLSTVVDSGEPRFKIFGVPIPMLGMALVIGASLPLWRLPRDSVIRWCTGIVFVWVGFQFAIGQSLRMAVLMLGFLVFGIAVGGVRSQPWLLKVQVRAAAIGPVLMVLMFYAGFWRAGRTGQQSVMGYQANHLADYLIMGAVAILGSALLSRGRTRLWLLALLPFFGPPLWVTGSRSGIGIMTICVTALLIVRSQLRTRAFLVAVGSIVGFFAVAFPLLLQFLPDSPITVRFQEQFSIGATLRLQLLWSGLLAISRAPWLGHGMDAPRSIDWLNDNMVYVVIDSVGAVTHNAYVDYFIMGGIGLGIVFILLHFRVPSLLFRLSRRIHGDARTYVAIAVAFSFAFMLDVFFGELFPKTGWFMWGFGLQVLAVYRQRHGLKAADGNGFLAHVRRPPGNDRDDPVRAGGTSARGDR